MNGSDRRLGLRELSRLSQEYSAAEPPSVDVDTSELEPLPPVPMRGLPAAVMVPLVLIVALFPTAAIVAVLAGWWP